MAGGRRSERRRRSPVLLGREYGSTVKDSTRLLVAAAVLVVGLAAAFTIPPGTCPLGELVEDTAEPGTYRCRISYDMFAAARSLVVLKYGVGIVSVIGAVALAASVLVRRRRASLGVAGEG